MGRLSKVSVMSNKGGVGKTFISISLGVCLARLFPEEKTVIVDLDPGSRTTSLLLGGELEGVEHDIFDYFNIPDVQPEEIVLRSSLAELSNLYIVPNTRGRDLDPALRSKEMTKKKLQRLLLYLEDIANFTVFDLPAGKKTLHTMLAAITTCLVVAQPKEDSLKAAESLILTLRRFGRELEKRGIKMTDYLVANAVFREDREEVNRVISFANRMGVSLAGIIPFSQAVEESIAAWKPLPLFKPEDPAAVAVCQLARRIAGMDSFQNYDLASSRERAGKRMDILSRITGFLKALRAGREEA